MEEVKKGLQPIIWLLLGIAKMLVFLSLLLVSLGTVEIMIRLGKLASVPETILFLSILVIFVIELAVLFLFAVPRIDRWVEEAFGRGQSNPEERKV